MRCLPVFIILLLLVPSGIIARPNTKDDVDLAPFHDDAKETRQPRSWCCQATIGSCCGYAA
uniref:Conotoxin n=1 Tax=Conus praecellens TaxID=128530 RepID=A0A291C2Z8_CONPC|nr:conotoxin [Conus praecellens]